MSPIECFTSCLLKFISFVTLITLLRSCEFKEALTGRLQKLTRASRQKNWIACVRRLVWTARALDHLQYPVRRHTWRTSSSVVRCCRARVVRYCVAAELEEATTIWYLVQNPAGIDTCNESTILIYHPLFYMKVYCISS